MSQVLNLTPHAVVIIDPACCEYDSRTRSYKLTSEVIQKSIYNPVEGPLPRVSTSEQLVDTIEGVEVFSVVFGEIDNLPEYTEGTHIVVSALVANAMKAVGRNDALVPHRVVRDADGKIVGCLAFSG